MIPLLRDQFPTLSLRQLSRLLGVSRSWYYAHPTPDALAERDLDLRDAIERVTLEFPGYGYRRVTHALQRDGWSVNHKRVLRVMRQESLLCQLKRRFLVTTDSGHGLPSYPNLLAQTTLSAPNQAWVADITYVRLPTTFVYLACVLDAYSRRCVGWKLSRQIDTQLALEALEMALTQRRPAPGLIHHSDRGVQSVCRSGVCRPARTGRRSGEHVRQGQSVRQCQG